MDTLTPWFSAWPHPLYCMQYRAPSTSPITLNRGTPTHDAPENDESNWHSECTYRTKESGDKPHKPPSSEDLRLVLVTLQSHHPRHLTQRHQSNQRNHPHTTTLAPHLHNWRSAHLRFYIRPQPASGPRGYLVWSSIVSERRSCCAKQAYILSQGGDLDFWQFQIMVDLAR